MHPSSAARISKASLEKDSGDNVREAAGFRKQEERRDEVCGLWKLALALTWPSEKIVFKATFLGFLLHVDIDVKVLWSERKFERNGHNERYR